MPVSSSRKPPSLLHDRLVARVFASQLTCRASPPAVGATYAFMNSLVAPERYAIHLPSGDHAIGRSRKKGGRPKTPCASTRACFVSTDTTHSSRASRRNATCLPSGEKRGDTAFVRPVVSAVSLFVAKS